MYNSTSETIRKGKYEHEHKRMHKIRMPSPLLDFHYILDNIYFTSFTGGEVWIDDKK